LIKQLQYLIIHCTATKENAIVRPVDIIQWHLSPKPQGRGWKRVGYSKLILLDGTIHSFINENQDDYVDYWEITNGVEGLNSVSRHICYVGGLDSSGKPKDTRTQEQIESMKLMVFATIKNHPFVKVAGHNQFANKACPSFDVPKWLRSINVPEVNIHERV